MCPKNNLKENGYIGKRFEFKYMLSEKQAIVIEKYIQDIGLKPDGHSENGPYIVNSLYYDTPLLDDYRDKDASLLVRKKIRIRMYDEVWHDDLKRVWFEVKKKHNMNIAKDRFEVPGDVWRKFSESNDVRVLVDELKINGITDRKAVESFIQRFSRQMYRPHVVVRYQRSAYLFNFLSLVRLTFDKNIVACEARDMKSMDFCQSVSGNQVIMEIKFNEKLPWWFGDMLTRFDLSRTDFSKYRHSVAMLRGVHRISLAK